nr:hypothetical protein [Evansella caseinilytica]
MNEERKATARIRDPVVSAAFPKATGAFPLLLFYALKKHTICRLKNQQPIEDVQNERETAPANQSLRCIVT